MLRSISLPSIQKKSSMDYNSFHAYRKNSLNNSSSSLTHTKFTRVHRNLDLPIQHYIATDKNAKCEYLLSGNAKYLISYSIFSVINKIYIININNNTTEFSGECPNYKVIIVSKNGDFIVCACMFSNKLRNIQLIQKLKKNTNNNQNWQQNIQRYSALPTSTINTMAINNNKLIIANYINNKINIWYEGSLIKQTFLGALFSRKIATWISGISIAIDSYITNIKFDSTNCSRLFVITKNKTLKIFYQNINNYIKWEEKHSIINCVSFPDSINNTGDILLFFKGKCLTIRRYNTKNTWNIDTIVLDEIIIAAVFLPMQTTDLLIYSKNNMYACLLKQDNWIISKQPIPLKKTALKVLASSDNNSNTIIYNSKKKQSNESTDCTIL